MKENYHIDLSKYLIKQGPKFCSQMVIEKNGSLLIKPTFKGLLFNVTYLVIALFLLLAAVINYLSQDGISELLFFLLGGATFLGVFGFFSIKKIANQGVFDQEKKKFKSTLDRSVLFENILAFQINSKKILASGGEVYPCYELNMLTANGRRINLLNHNNLEIIKKDAKKISDLLNVKVNEYV